MNTQNCADPKNAVYEDLRYLISLSETADKPSRIPAWLKRPQVWLLAGCASLVLVGVSGFVIQHPWWSGPLSGETTLDRSPERGSIADIPAALPVAAPSPLATGAFIVRVGSFRDPSNAERMAASLRQRTLNIRTKVVPASGLYVVTLGPFSQKGTAEHIARSVQEVTGLVPQVLRQEF